MKIALIAAAGKSERMRGEGSKQYLLLAGKPVLSHTLQVFENCPVVDKIIVVVNPEDVDYGEKQIVQKFNFTKVFRVIAGGERRQDSVMNGLLALPSTVSAVIVHDGARPLISPELITQAVLALEEWAGVVVGVPVKDTVKKVSPGGEIKETLSRGELWFAQTPQVFLPGPLMKAHQQAQVDHFYGTDDAVLLERAGYRLRMITGSYENIKITTPEDLIVAEAILRKREEGG